MKKYIFLISIFLIMLNAYSQECGYKEYHSLVESAENDYKKKNYETAREKLELAFTKVDFPLGKDLNLAFSVAQKCDDSEWAEHVAIQLAKGGVPIKFFLRYKKSKWFEKFKSNFQLYSDYYNENFEPEVRDRFLSMINRDKEFNKKYHQWRKKEIEISLEELIDGATQIISDFTNLTDEFGFPTEKIMGYNYLDRKNKVGFYPTDAFIIHTYQRGVLVFKDEIGDIVCNGGLHPNSERTLKTIRGYGNGTGVRQEMEARFQKFRGGE